MKMLLLAGSIALAALASAPAMSQTAPSEAVFTEDYAQAADVRTLFRNGEEAAALELGWPLALAGNPVAQNIVGVVLTDEGYEDYDLEEGLFWLSRAAVQGLDLAWHNIGVVHTEDHDGKASNELLSMTSFRISAEMGYLPSIQELAYVRSFGGASVVDYALARDWIEEGFSIDPLDPYLTTILADHYYYGLGLEVDYAVALRLFEQAAADGDAYAEFSVAHQYYFGDGTERDFALAREYFERAAAQDYSAAYGHLAEIWYNGNGVEPDTTRSLEIAQRGTELEDPFSMVMLGHHFIEGHGVEVDFDRARALYQTGADNGALAGAESLADMAYLGQGEPQDYEKAFDLFEQVLDNYPDRSYAAYSMAYMLMRGEGVEVDVAAAVPLMESAFAAGERYAFPEMPLIYGHPDYAGPHADPVRAMAFCLVAADEQMLDPVEQDETVFACELLEATLAPSQVEAAVALYQSL